MTGPFGEFEALATSTDDGQPDKRFPMTGKGGIFRFAWGEPGRRSSYWKVDARPTGDVYVFERSYAEDFKISLHQSGQWHIAYLRQRDGQYSAPAQDYYKKNGTIRLDEWSRPAPNGPMTEALFIAVTSDDILSVADDGPPPKKPGVTWLDPPDPGTASFVSIQLVTPPQPFEQRNRQYLWIKIF